MNIVRPPSDIRPFRVFLSGSIDMGNADDWQTRVEKALSDLPITIYNPRRDDWDSSWVQSIEHDQFREQVQWEIRAMEDADIIAVYFDPLSSAPITLLELGLHAQSRRQIVCCPDGFYRKGNVDIVCRRYGIKQVPTLDALIEAIRKEAQAHRNPVQKGFTVDR